MLRTITLTSADFLAKFKTKEYDLIPYNFIGTEYFNIPARLVTDQIGQNNVIEITSNIDDIKITYYLPIYIDVNLFLNEYHIDHKNKTIIFTGKTLYTTKMESVTLKLGDFVKLYYLVSIEDWKNAILMAYNMVLNHEHSESLYFTNKDVYMNLIGNQDNIGRNIQLGVNQMLKNNNKKGQIDLGSGGFRQKVTYSDKSDQLR